MSSRRKNPSPNDRALHRIDYRVQLSEDHPSFSETHGGILSIWVLERSAVDAFARTGHYLHALPFQPVGSEARCLDQFDPPNEAMKILIEMVKLVGFSAYFEAADRAADIETIPFYGESTRLTK